MGYLLLLIQYFINMKKHLLPLAMLAIVLGGCLNTHTHEHEAEESGPEPLAYTLYTEKTELFVEFKPLTVGEESRFAAHFTHLGEVFTPFTEGTINLTLEVGGEKTTITATEPQVAGIFRLALTPEKAGNAKLTFDIKTKSYTDQIVIEGLKVYADEAAALADETDGSADPEITYLKEQAWKVEFANEAVTRKTFHNVLRTSGEILSAPGDEMIVAAKSRGIVLFNGSAPIVGSKISEGSQLFLISGGDMASGNMEAEYQEAKNNLEKAKADHDRNTALYEKEVIAVKDFQATKVAFENAKTVFEMLSRNYTKDGQQLKAPMSGYLKHVYVSEGEFVEAGTPLASISKNEKLVLQANVSQQDYGKLPNIKSAHFKSPMSDEMKSTEDLNGRVLSYGKSATDGSPFIPINFEIANRGELVSGSMVEVYLISEKIPNALVIPRSALMEQQGRLYVYVQSSGEGFDRKEVTLGADDGMDVQVLSGLKEGERVVTKGAYQIKLASASGAIPAHGHEH